MKIVAALKQVAVPQEGFRIDEEARALQSRFLTHRLNEWDDYALEEAVTLVERHGGELVAMSVGEPRCEEILFAAMARGAARATRIDPAGLDLSDPFDIAGALAAAIRPEQPDLVLCGVMASDDLMSTVGVALAHALGLPAVAVVTSLELQEGQVVAGRELEGGAVQRVRVPLPAVLTIQTGINEPRYASMRGIMMARRKPIRTTSIEELGFRGRREGLRPTVERLFVPQRTKQTRYLEGSPQEIAGQLLEVFADKGVR